MRKNSTVFLYITLFFLLPVILSAAIKGGQNSIAKKYAEPGQAPVVISDPGTGEALGYVLYANIDNEPGDEIIIPYKIRKSDREVEDKADPYLQKISVTVVKGEEVIRDFITLDIAYARTPKVYMKVKQFFSATAPKVFLMAFDGVGKRGGPDEKLTLVYNSLDPKDKGKKLERFETVQMPWDLILYRYSDSAITITEFSSQIRESSGVFYIRTLSKDAKWPKIPAEQVDKMKAELKKLRPEMYWEYGYE